jgi:hypothetical protein
MNENYNSIILLNHQIWIKYSNVQYIFICLLQFKTNKYHFLLISWFDSSLKLRQKEIQLLCNKIF